MRGIPSLCLSLCLILLVGGSARGQRLHFDAACTGSELLLADQSRALPIYVAPTESETLRLTANAVAEDLSKLTGQRPRLIDSLAGEESAILFGTLDHSPEIDALVKAGRIDVSGIRGKWESAEVAVVEQPTKTLRRALVVVGSDRRGAAYALFDLSRAMGVSPWTWWADVPVPHRQSICMESSAYQQTEPSVRYRGIFLNDEDWGLRPWASQKMDAELHNIGPHTYRQIFELLLRLHANLLWPAMHPGTLAFNAVPENAKLADDWGIVMGSSHSELLLRNNVGEWSIPHDGAWNYQSNHARMDSYWRERLQKNGHFENVYTVGLRGLHDSGLEGGGSVAEKARLVEQAIAAQRRLIGEQVDPHAETVPQVLWLYKESLELYRAGMKLPEDVTLGWTDDNYGYLRQLSTAEEQRRKGGSAVYYHVSYWGFPHDYLWLSSTPTTLMREELTKAWDHGARRLWVLNVGDIKPAEKEIDYFMQLAWNLPDTEKLSQLDFLRRWYGEQFGADLAEPIAEIVNQAQRLNFIRRPEFMGFNGYNDQVRLTDFNPLAWGDQNRQRIEAWQQLSNKAEELRRRVPNAAQSSYFELVAYPVEAAAAHNAKFLWNDRSYLEAWQHHLEPALEDFNHVRAAYQSVQDLTEQYNALEAGKWRGMMDAAPRVRQVFYRPTTAIEAGGPVIEQLPSAWAAPDHAVTASCKEGYGEIDSTVSIPAEGFARQQDANGASWQVLKDLGIAGASLVFGRPGLTASFDSAPGKLTQAPWVEYDFTSLSAGAATLTLHLLPVFPVDAKHQLRMAVSVDGQAPHLLDQSGSGEWKEGSAPTWEKNVLRNDALLTLPLGAISPGQHHLRFYDLDPGVVLQQLVISFPGSAVAYPAPPATLCNP